MRSSLFSWRTVLIPPTTKQYTKANNIGRHIILLFGLLCIAWGLLSASLLIFGQKSEAVITHIRREGGERDETIRGRYTYVVSYVFVLADGRRMVGSTRKISGAVYLKATQNTSAPVLYYAFFPQINTLEEKSTLRGTPLWLVVVGGMMIWLVRKKDQRPRKANPNTPSGVTSKRG